MLDVAEIQKLLVVIYSRAILYVVLPGGYMSADIVPLHEPEAWTTRGGKFLAHITHVVGRGFRQLVGTIDGQSSSQLWDSEGRSTDGNELFDLIKRVPKKP
jgi:hypothetical protein